MAIWSITARSSQHGRVLAEKWLCEEVHPTHWLICAQVVARPADDEPQLEAGTFEDGEAQDPGVAEAPSQRLRGRRPLRGVRRARRPAALAPPSPRGRRREDVGVPPTVRGRDAGRRCSNGALRGAPAQSQTQEAVARARAPHQPPRLSAALLLAHPRVPGAVVGEPRLQAWAVAAARGGGPRPTREFSLWARHGWFIRARAGPHLLRPRRRRL